MSYYFSKVLKQRNFDEAVEYVTDELKKMGFGIVTEIDMKAVFKKKIDKDINDYKILGACNPNYAFKAVAAEERIGLMLPCNVIVRGLEDGAIEVAAVDPIASMSSVDNDNLGPLAEEVKDKLEQAIQNMN